MKKRRLTQWQSNKIKVFMNNMLKKYSYILDDIKKEAEDYFESEGVSLKNER